MSQAFFDKAYSTYILSCVPYQYPLYIHNFPIFCQYYIVPNSLYITTLISLMDYLVVKIIYQAA